MVALLLGVDGGNTKTVALVATREGTIAGAGRALGCADVYAAAEDDLLAVVGSAVAAALAEAGASGKDVAGAAFSMAGADWPEDHALLRRMLPATVGTVGEAGGPRDVLVVNDAIGALRAAIPHGPGVVVVAGTGTATGARGPDGRTWHSSFWQEPQGARELGWLALRAACRAELGVGPATSLGARLLAATGAGDVESLLHAYTRRPPDRRRDVDTLAAVLLDAAEDGDAEAAGIVEAHGTALGRTALAAARRVGAADGPLALALAGGLFRHRGRRLADALAAEVAAGAPGARTVRPELEPVVGALLVAMDAAGVRVDEAVEGRLRASLPGAALYESLSRDAR